MGTENGRMDRDQTVTREKARALEEDFFGRFRMKISGLGKVFNPMDGRSYSVDPSAGLKEWDGADKVKRIMLEKGVLDRSIRRRMPANKACRIDAGKRGLFFGFKPAVSIVGISLSPLEELVENDSARGPIEYPDLEEAVKKAADRFRVFHYIGVLATTRFSRECVDRAPRSKNMASTLVEKGDDSAWRILNGEDLPWRGAEAMFDLETGEEKADRARRWILAHRELQMRGGHVRIQEIRKEMGFSEEIVRRALAEILDRSEEFQIRVFDGTEILQRSRF